MRSYPALTRLLLAPVLCAPLLAQAATYTVTAIGGIGSQVTGINNSGQVVGYTVGERDGTTTSSAFLFSNGSTTDLGNLDPYYQRSSANAINDAGQIVGTSSSAGSEYGEAFLYAGNGPMTGLGKTGVYFSSASAINASGLIVGNGDAGTRGENSAFLYAGAGLVALGNFGGNNSYAYGVNNLGQIVGSASYFENQVQHAYIYENGVMTDLTPGGSAYSVAIGINDAGQILINDSGRSLLYQNGSSIDLGALGGSGASASAINQLGQVVGSSGEHAFLYTANGMLDLNTLIDPASGWTITSASDINDSGQIAATACNAFGCQGVRLDIASAVPEPSTYGMLLGGLGLLALVARRRPRDGARRG